MSFDFGVSFSDPAWSAVAPTLYWTQIECAHFIVNQSSSVAHAPPGPPSAAAAGAALCGAAAPGALTAAPAAAAGVAPSRIRQAKPQTVSRVTVTIAATFDIKRSTRFLLQRIVFHNHGLNNGSNQSSHGAGVLVMPATYNHQRNAGACDYSREGWTGTKFGMKIRTRIGGMSTINREK